MTPWPPHMHNLPHHQHSPLEGTFVTVNEPTLTHHHSQSMVDIRAHSWWCTFYGFGHMSNDVYSPSCFHTE